ncbi:uncharacterized protein [Nicotiana sylvestris]|uniref:uncharacterized protein n=1 Tax=Nicotiana sylvestris TaxID=4096 RepID=UPI00388CA4B7
MKIDLRKAYDMVSWEFLEEALRGYDFPDKFIQWIIICVFTAKFTIKVNGEGHGYFDGDTSSVNRVMEALDHFSKASGLIANMEKSNIFVAGIKDEIKAQLMSRTKFTEMFPIKYLGLPLSPKRWNKKDCQMLIGKIIHRISVTYSKQLSYAGRLQVVNSVLFSIHSFWGNVFILPQSVVKGVDRQQKLEVADLVWTTVAQPKHRFIGWLETLGKLLTKDRMIGMQIQVENVHCILCNEDTLESQDHLFAKCGWITTVRQELNIWAGHDVQYTGVKQMLEQIKRKHRKQFKKEVIVALYLAMVYYTWRARSTKKIQGRNVNIEEDA